MSCGLDNQKIDDECDGGHEDQIGQLQLQSLNIQDSSSRCPIEELPNETLGEIFDYACDWNVLQELSWTWEYPPPISSPIISGIPVLSIGATCARWHALVASLPNLWSRLKLQFSARKRLPDDPYIAILEQFLQRSGNWPLDLDVHVKQSFFMTHSQMWTVVTRLFPHINRWRMLKLDIRDVLTGTGWCPPGTRLDLPALEVLHFDPAGSDFLKVFGRTPNLQTLQLIGRHHASDPPLSMDLERISCATVVATSQLDQVSDLYPNVTNLTLIQTQSCILYSALSPKTIGVTSLALIVEDTENRTLLETVLESFTLPRLTELGILSFSNRLFESSSKSHDGSWASMAPRLEQLRLHLLSKPRCGSPYTRPWPQSLWDSFALRSSCKLTALTLVAIPLSDLTLVNIISLQPLLEDLRIEDSKPCGPRNSPITRHLISHLTLPTPNTADASSSSSSQIPPLVPRLRHLSLNCGAKRFDDLAFIRMVCSRWLPAREKNAEVIGMCSLRSVTIHFRRRYIMAAVYRPLKELDKMGLRVIVTSAKGKYKI